ncbi:putative IQ motif, EF-hand binding, P-loop containing nucleoside triphosphate hydrolase [Medicago truncatula]|uniref:Putative IQ motif, EF-hand binding, P-loop containing nucleoside triphosphate hydrolase n=1 Tax=Medicago truncatula TaxID=3880 RepID=A0A396GSH6_MEDTR|nr:putative IQ motif, EF-hand binding, P-loop containing nucleoside triphosphate hydrolase [Medicago truncatula]
MPEIIITEIESTMDVNPPESAAIIIQASIRGYLVRRALLKSKNVVKLQAVVRVHLVRRHDVGASRCIQAITKMQALFSVPNHNSTMGLGVNIARMKGGEI